MIAKDKLTAEGGLSETKTILRWYFNFTTLTVTLPEHKHIACLPEIKLMIQACKTTKNTLELTIGCMGQVGFMIPWVYHFLSCLRSLLVHSEQEDRKYQQQVRKGLRINKISLRQGKK